MPERKMIMEPEAMMHEATVEATVAGVHRGGTQSGTQSDGRNGGQSECEFLNHGSLRWLR